MDTWLLDSGCIGDESIFQEFDTTFNFKVKLGNDALIDVTGKGTSSPPYSRQLEATPESTPRRIRSLRDIYETGNFTVLEPESFEVAAKQDVWIKAIEEEIKMIEKNETWELIEQSLELTFLNGYLQEEIYVKQPPGFVVEGFEDKVLKLKKALYGLKQAPRAWYSRIDGYFTDQGFRRSKSEPTLYIKTRGNTETLIVSLYVDDLIYTGNSEPMIQEFKEDMMKTFKMSDLGLMHYFLCIEISQEEN
ncbi:hypothetical protein RJ640_010687 [Escallonia rubra]|uniref:Reverse transcriptase Ty1/copia-type domain-containing protein n=1 Tax=Escallonia rubra TaxID=112253 RepID=A0AA88S0V2_9ASTE|nr:hypothetical protein RJ640_010687 [Escallonia rubra]